MVPDDGTIAWRDLVAETVPRLGRAGIQRAAQEVRWLVEEASGCTGADYLAGLDHLCTRREVARFDEMVGRRLAGEPIQYVLGHWAFRHLDLMIDRRVLIPRPETEVLVSVALDELARRRCGEPLLAGDLGTGSGAIGLSLAFETRDVHVVGVESSADALAVARANLAGLGRHGSRVQLVEGSWFEPLGGSEGSFDLIASNPPYIAVGETLPGSVRDWEPAEALLAGADGLDSIRSILGEVARWLRPGGAVVVELAPAQVEVASAMALDGGLVEVQINHDLAGRPRVLCARNP